MRMRVATLLTTCTASGRAPSGAAPAGGHKLHICVNKTCRRQGSKEVSLYCVRCL